MAFNLNAAVHSRARSYVSEPMHFQRREGKTKKKKIQRKIKLRFRHILFYIILMGGIFFALQRSYLFLICWDKLDIQDVTVISSMPRIQQEIQQFLEGKHLGNILLLDIGLLQGKFTAHRWIKEVRVRKILPSTLKIEIKERTPAALLKQRHTYLIDEEGVFLEKMEQEERMDLPLLVDSNKFQKDYEEKINLAWECLHSLSPSQKEQVEVLDLSEFENVTVKLKDNPTRLILGNERFSEKINLYTRLRTRLERFGNLEYVDLRLHDRLYIKPKNTLAQRNTTPNASKEAF